jgi:trans-aconitate 2-methyltransferase
MWNPDQYERFKQERKQPFLDLLALIERPPSMRVADLGCGTGELTRELHDSAGAVETTGIDNSEAMLARSAEFAGDGVRFERSDIGAFAPDTQFDLIFSNAALQWIPDHVTLLTRLASFLAPGGQIAIQMPANDSHPSHATAAEVARTFGVEPRHDPILAVDEYARLLHSLGFERQNVRMQVYGHLLDSTASVIEWVKGTLLTEYETRLAARYPQFLDAYSKLLLERLGDQRPYFYTYKRILIWASL